MQTRTWHTTAWAAIIGNELRAAVLMLALPLAASAQSSVVGEIGGFARDASGKPLAGIEVVLIGSGQVEADSLGSYRFTNVPAGPYFLRATKLGLRPVLKNIQLGEGEHLRVDITMDAAAQLLSAVIVRADSASAERSDPTGFLHRQRTGQGTYITGDEIERRHIARTEHLFNGMPNIRVDTGGIILVARGKITYMDLFAPRGGSRDSTDPQLYYCVGVQVFVDGSLMPQPFNVNDVPPQAIKGIELYKGPATTPIELRSPKSACGTLAIWTR